jgi:arsenate reductase
MAEALMNHLGARRFRAFSAGSMPKGEVNPHALPLVRALGFMDEDFRSKPWDEFAAPGAPALDFVITVCDNAAGEVCPVWPGQPITADWGVPDPAAAVGSEAEVAVAFRDAARQLRNRIELLVALPAAGLDRMSLQTRLRDIGTISDNQPA